MKKENVAIYIQHRILFNYKEYTKTCIVCGFLPVGLTMLPTNKIDMIRHEKYPFKSFVKEK